MNLFKPRRSRRRFSYRPPAYVVAERERIARQRRRQWRAWRKRFSALSIFNPLDLLLAPLLPPKNPWMKTRRDLITVKLQLASATLLLLTLISVLLASLPLRLGTAEWYLQATANLVGNSPILIAGFTMGALALYFTTGSQATHRLARALTVVCRLSLALFVALLPLQLLAGAWLVQQIRSNDRAQVERLRNDGAALVQEARAATSKEAFSQLLRRRSIALDEAVLAANPLAVAQTGLEQSLAANVGRLEDQLATRRRQTLLRTGVNLLKLFSTCLVMALFFKLYLAWSLERDIRERPAGASLVSVSASDSGGEESLGPAAR